MGSPVSVSPSIYVIHENPVWLPPFAAAFNRLALPWQELDLSVGTFDLGSTPADGVYYCRMSASSHTRGHRYSAELTACVLAWLTRHGKIVVNGPRALDLEISKVRQYSALEAAGLLVPRTVFIQDTDSTALLTAAETHFKDSPFILKPNRGGKGYGVHLFTSVSALKSFLSSTDAEKEAPVDGIWLLQQYIQSEKPVITRAEFIGGKFLYAVEVDTSKGFRLCPAPECQIQDIGDANCPVSVFARPSSQAVAAAPTPKFTILPAGAVDPVFITQIESFLSAAGVDVAGVEFIQDQQDGRTYIYDVNTNTNYNPAAEEEGQVAGTDASGPGALAKYLGERLADIQQYKP